MAQKLRNTADFLDILIARTVGMSEAQLNALAADLGAVVKSC